MRAVVVDEPGGISSLCVREIPEPPSRGDLVRIDVAACGVSYADLVCIRGDHQLRPELPFVPGLEIAGTVIGAPAGSRLLPGDRVMAYVDFGGYAECVNASPLLTVRIPDGMSLVEAAALPLNVLTALYALTHRARVNSDDLVVVHGAAGGLGAACIRVAVEAGADVIAVVSEESRGELAVSAGASSFLIADRGWPAAVRELATARGLAGATVVVDPVGGDRLLESIRCLAPEGRLASLGFVGGIPQVGVNKILVRNIDLIGVDWVPESTVTATVLVPEFERLLSKGTFHSFAAEAASLEDVGAVLGALGARSFVGKAVLLTGRSPVKK